MAEVSFEALMNMKAEDIERPKPLPEGTYLVMVKGLPEHIQVGEKQTHALSFTLQFVQPYNDVDQNALAEALNGAALSDKSVNLRQFITDLSIHRVKKFLFNDLAIDDAKGKKTVMQAKDESPGKQCYAKIKHRIGGQDSDSVFLEVTSTARC